ncbi:MAG: AbrB/MazE/SpoVT family DNA-binding domain-containing protein [Caldilineaceae bacterium]|nr:AbrB/MazE/SpoVT family DNA-binding domain-containing protein [Caldilineaceae bacterium]
MLTAKVFQSGGSQAVRIPKSVRFDCEEVIVKQTPVGLLLIPREEDFWSRWLEQLRAFQWDVAVEDVDDALPQERDWDGLFA